MSIDWSRSLLVGVCMLTACSPSLAGDYRGTSNGASHHLILNPDGSYREMVDMGPPVGAYTIFGYWRKGGSVAVLVADSDVSSTMDGRTTPTERTRPQDTAAWWRPRRFAREGAGYLLAQPYDSLPIRFVKVGD